MNWIQSLTKAIQYIESNLTNEITATEIANHVYASNAHFQRVFSLAAGITIGDYIRNRRLSLAGQDLLHPKNRIIDIAMLYQYDSQESFTKAFTRFHGITPYSARKQSHRLKYFRPLIINITIQGGFDKMNEKFKSIEKLCEVLALGKLTSEPAHIYWGYSHKVYAVTTTQGKYAVKALNPQETNLESIILMEKIVKIVAERIKAVPAKVFDNKIVQEIDGQQYLVFDWIEGEEIEYDAITPEHSRIMGTILAEIHQTDFSALNISSDVFPRQNLVDWNFYMQKGEEGNAVWIDLLKENIDMLSDYYAKGVEASNSLTEKNIISHCVLDPRHVIWQGYTPYLVDWKNAGMINPLYDFLNTAIHWSEHGSEKDRERFSEFARGYDAKNKFPAANWRNVVYKRYLEPLNWLAFNLERSLNNTDPDDQQVGAGQAEDMIREAISYSGRTAKLEKWLSEL